MRKPNSHFITLSLYLSVYCLFLEDSWKSLYCGCSWQIFWKSCRCHSPSRREESKPQYCRRPKIWHNRSIFGYMFGGLAIGLPHKLIGRAATQPKVPLLQSNRPWCALANEIPQGSKRRKKHIHEESIYRIHQRSLTSFKTAAGNAPPCLTSFKPKALWRLVL